MTWLESWEGSYNGDWYGSQEPEPEGSMRATLRGRATVAGTLTTGQEESKPKKGSSRHKKAIQREDDEILLLVSAYYGIASNNWTKATKF